MRAIIGRRVLQNNPSASGSAQNFIASPFWAPVLNVRQTTTLKSDGFSAFVQLNVLLRPSLRASFDIRPKGNRGALAN